MLINLGNFIQMFLILIVNFNIFFLLEIYVKILESRGYCDYFFNFIIFLSFYSWCQVVLILIGYKKVFV